MWEDINPYYSPKMAIFMIKYQWVFLNYSGRNIFLVFNTWLHILEKHPEITLSIIENTLRTPDLILKSDINPQSEIYYLDKMVLPQRFSVVIVKIKSDGYWISTAMTKSKISNGTVVYRRE